MSAGSRGSQPLHGSGDRSPAIPAIVGPSKPGGDSVLGAEGDITAQHLDLGYLGPTAHEVYRTEPLRARELEHEPPDPSAAKLAEVRAVFAVFDWERDDRQCALEQIEEIVTDD